MNSITAHLLNNFFAIFFLAPMVVMYWRGSFWLLDIYNFPDHANKYLAGIVEVSIGVVGNLLFNYMQVWMAKSNRRIRSPVLQIFTRRWYSYFFAWSVVCIWKGTWRLWDVATGFVGEQPPHPVENMHLAWVCFVVGLVPLLLTRCWRNTTAPPLACGSDLADTFFVIATRFRTSRSRWFLHFLDNLFSIAVVVPLVTCCWRGVWYLLDYYFTPDRPFFTANVYLDSYLMSIVTGLTVAVVAILLQHPAARVSASLEKRGSRGMNFLKIFFEDVFYILPIFASIDIWRGYWGIYDVFVFPSDRIISAWITHGTGFIGLMLMFHSSSAVAKGCQYDGEHMNGDGCWFPAKCLSIFDHFFQPEQPRDSIVESMSASHIYTVDDVKPFDPCETEHLRRTDKEDQEDNNHFHDKLLYRPDNKR